MPWTLVLRHPINEAVKAAFHEVEEAFSHRNISHRVACSPPDGRKDKQIFIGLSDDDFMSLTLPDRPSQQESYRQTQRGNLRLLCAADARGLAYALQDFAESIHLHGEKGLEAFPERWVKPDQKLRGVAKFISHSGDEAWWQDENYWRSYLSRISKARFNRLTLVMGFDTAYLSPPYPFMVDVDKHPEVQVAKAFAGKKASCRQALSQIGDLCHAHGLQFCLAIWQQIPWQEGQKSVVHGLSEDNLEDYCALGLQALLAACPQIDLVHFRVNHESGVGGQDSAENYWLSQIDALAKANQTQGRDRPLELRAKGMTDRMLRHAKDRGLKVLVSTKYCCEHAALPHHLTQMRTEELKDLDNLNLARRYSYADLLRKPRYHPILYRLWSSGSLNLFTWADPDYVRRFMDSLALGPGEGYEVMAPLSYKGGHEWIHRSAFESFKDPKYRLPAGEEHRHALFYQLFGRMGYDKDAKDQAMKLWLERSYGEKTESLLPLIEAYSKLMPFLTAVHFPLHPQLLFWPELSTGGALYASHNVNEAFREQGMTYQKALACDEGLIYGIEEYVTDLAKDRLDIRYTPLQVSGWLDVLLETMQKRLKKVQEQWGKAQDAFLQGILLDAKMLLSLGRYHRQKQTAALEKARFDRRQSQDLTPAIEAMHSARSHWQSLCRLGQAYDDDLLFGVGEQCVRRGHWRDFLAEIDRDLAMLEKENPHKQAAQESLPSPSTLAPSTLFWQASVPPKHAAGKPLSLGLTLSRKEESTLTLPIHCFWRRTCQLDGPFHKQPMQKSSEGWHHTIPADKVDPDFDLLVYFGTHDAQGNARLFPGLFHPEHSQPYFHIAITDASLFADEERSST